MIKSIFIVERKIRGFSSGSSRSCFVCNKIHDKRISIWISDDGKKIKKRSVCYELPGDRKLIAEINHEYRVKGKYGKLIDYDTRYPDCWIKAFKLNRIPLRAGKVLPGRDKKLSCDDCHGSAAGGIWVSTIYAPAYVTAPDYRSVLCESCFYKRVNYNGSEEVIQRSEPHKHQGGDGSNLVQHIDEPRG